MCHGIVAAQCCVDNCSVFIDGWIMEMKVRVGSPVLLADSEQVLQRKAGESRVYIQ